MTPQAHRDEADLWRERSFAEFVAMVLAAVVLLIVGWVFTVAGIVVFG